MSPVRSCSGSLLLCAALGLPPLLAAPEAHAFCGFFVSGADAALTNSASQVALLRKGNHTWLTMSNNYKGPPEDFAMVVPVPVVLKKEQVKTLGTDVFKHVDQLSAPRLVEYWEQDPCTPQLYPAPPGAAFGGVVPTMAPMAEGGGGNLGVKIEAKFEVGEYQILILSAKDSGGLETWLHLNKYKIPKGASEALAPYIREQQKFFVAKVDIKKVKRDEKGFVVLSPLRFDYDAQELRLPVRLGLLNAPSGQDAPKQDLIVYVLHPEKRFEVSNYRNVFIPTNIEVTDAVRTQFPGFYAELFDETLRRNNNRAVVTEYAWQTTSCDPCPTPPLDASDLYTLGDESYGNGKSSPGGGPRGGPFFGAAPSYVLTRLHTRYDKQSLSEDLLFREGEAVVGGRANWDGGLGDHGAQIQKGGVSNFQGRYIIRHYWEKAVTCKNPRYGVWGGPPGSGGEEGKPGAIKPAEGLANAPRGQVKLPQVVQTAVPELGLAGAKPRPLRPGEKAPAKP
ncbi:MAG: DUF2330 domain-containing protein [Polyangia bacterium]